MVLDSDNEESMKDIVVGDLEYQLLTLDLQIYYDNFENCYVIFPIAI